MDNEKLLIGGVIVIALVIAIPIIAPMLSKEDQYDPIVDSHKLQELNDAVAQYGQQFGQYPPSLHYLVPDFISEVPVTSTRLQFTYDPATGAVMNPSAPAAAAPPEDANPRRRRSGGLGLSPATEGMTGLGASQELKY